MPWMPDAALQDFVNSVAALQMSHGKDIVYAYLNFRNPANGLIGDVGCKIHHASPLECYWTNATAFRTTVSGTNILSGAKVVSSGFFSQNEMYLNEIMAQKAPMRGGMPNGIWLSPDAWSDAENGVSVELLSYSYPVAFDAAGNVSVAFTIDMRISELQTYLRKAKAANEGEIVLIDVRSVVQASGFNPVKPLVQGIVLGSSDANRTMLAGQLYRAGATPIERLNGFTNAALPLMYGSSSSYFSQGAMIGSMAYNVRNVRPPMAIDSWTYQPSLWTLIQRAPERTPANIAGAAVGTLMSSMELFTDQIKRTYVSEASTCYDLGMSANTTAYFQALEALQSKLGNVYFSYMSYQLPGGNISRWGDCGCETRGAG